MPEDRLLRDTSDESPVGDGAGSVWPALAVVGIWMVPALLESAQYMVSASVAGTTLEWPGAALRAFPKWFLWAALTPAVLLVARRCPLAWKKPISLVVHLGAAVAFTTLHLILSAAAFHFLVGSELTLGALVARYLTNIFAVDFMAYWAVVGGFTAFDYYRQARDRELAASRLERRLVEARLRALRAQLNPHFLFNALNAVSSLVLEGDDEKTVRVVSRLSNLLRATLDVEGPLHRVDQELSLVEAYLDIERARFPDRLNYEIHTEGPVGDLLVPPLVLLPLAENAVRHGVLMGDGPGTVRVTATFEAEGLRLTVTDDGPGLESGGAGGTGVGLENTRARLQGLYGSEAELTLGTRSEGGVEASVLVPAPAGDIAHPEARLSGAAP